MKIFTQFTETTFGTVKSVQPISAVSQLSVVVINKLRAGYIVCLLPATKKMNHSHVLWRKKKPSKTGSEYRWINDELLWRQSQDFLHLFSYDRFIKRSRSEERKRNWRTWKHFINFLMSVKRIVKRCDFNKIKNLFSMNMKTEIL